MENKEVKQPERVSLPTATMNEVLAIFSQMPFGQVNAIIQKIQAEVQGLPDLPVPEGEEVPEKELDIPPAAV